MSPLKFPLKDSLRDPVDEASVRRIGLALAARERRPSRRRLYAGVMVGAAAVAILVVAWPHLRRETGALRFADGRDLATMAAGTAGLDVGLSDGSRIRLAPDARVEPLQSSGRFFSALVSQGRADFEVRPGGPRHWVIECGLATVEVVGTAFSCERRPGRLRVEVRHGIVLVRGDRVPERARRLVAGEILDLDEEPPPTQVGVKRAEPLPLPEPAPAAPPPAPGWKTLARRGHHGEAFAMLGSEGIHRETKRLGVADLLALADVARLSGHPAEAVRPLERILDTFAADPQAPLAAFALGRLELDSLGHARAAAVAFTRALALGIPKGLREDARARLVEAYARGGDRAGAQRAAEAYRQEFPDGRHAQSIQGWLRQP